MPDLPVEGTMAIASVAGATAAGLANRSTDPVWRKVAEGLSGALVGVMCGPAIADQLRVGDDHARIGVAFAVGAVGIILLTLLLDVAKSGSFKAWTARFLPQPPKPPGL